MTPLKILYVIDLYRNPYAGTESQLYRLAQGMVDAGHDVHMLVFQSSPFTDSGAFPCPVTVLGHRRLGAFATWLELWRVAKAFRQQGFLLAHVFFNDPSLICPPVFALAGLKVIISRRDMGYWYTPVVKAWLRFNSRLVTGAIVNSQAVKDVTVHEEWIAPDRIEVIYNGYPLDLPPGTDCPQELADWRHESAVVAVIVANVRPIKRIEDAVEALGSLAGKFPALRLLLVGDGDASALMALAAQRGVAERFRCIGARSNPVDYIRHADIGLLCSQSEGFSNAIIEYMQCGKPVVCSRVGGNPEAVEDDGAGFLYEAGDIDALAGRLARLLESPELRERMGQYAARIVRERFGVDVMIGQHEALYSSWCETQ